MIAPSSRIWLAMAVVILAVCISFERREDIDINSGRLRFQTAIGPLVISEKVQDTPFSELMGQKNAADWRRVNTKGVFGGHGRCGFAASELKRFTLVCDESRLDHQSRQIIGSKLLELLRQDEFGKMEKVIDEVAAKAVSDDEGQKALTD